MKKFISLILGLSFFSFYLMGCDQGATGNIPNTGTNNVDTSKVPEIAQQQTQPGPLTPDTGKTGNTDGSASKTNPPAGTSGTGAQQNAPQTTAPNTQQSVPQNPGTGTLPNTPENATTGRQQSTTQNATPGATAPGTQSNAPQNTVPGTQQGTTPNVVPGTQNNTQQGTVANTGDVVKDIFANTNNERKKQGLAELKLNDGLCKLAAMKSKDMYDKNYFSHVSPTYGDPAQMVRSNGFNYSNVGENIYMSSGMTPSGSYTVEKWMNSPGHRANILSPNYKEIGIGIYYSNGRYYATQIFYTSQ